MAKSSQRRKKKRRGTQGGRIDTRPRSRPKTRAEARQRAAARGKKKGGAGGRRGVASDGAKFKPPTWPSALRKGGLAAVGFFVLLVLVLKRPPGPSALIMVAMVGFYVPMSYFMDGFLYRREQDRMARDRARKAAEEPK